MRTLTCTWHSNRGSQMRIRSKNGAPRTNTAYAAPDAFTALRWSCAPSLPGASRYTVSQQWSLMR